MTTFGTAARRGARALAALLFAMLAACAAKAAVRPAANADEVLAQARAAKPGDEVQLTRSGDYGLLRLVNVRKRAPLVIRPAPGVKAQALVAIQRSSNLTIRDIHAIYSGPSESRYLVSVGSSDHIRLEGLEVAGPGRDGKVGGVLIRNCRTCAFVGGRLHGLYQAFAHLDNDGLAITDNQFFDGYADAIRGGGTSNLLIARNHISDLYRIDGNHPDCIQNWTTHTKEPAVNLTFEDNVCTRGGGDPTQGIFIGDEARHGYPSVRIVGNAIIGGMYNGIGCGGCVNPYVHDNFVQGREDSRSARGRVMKPWIMLRGGQGGDWGGNWSTGYSVLDTDPPPAKSDSNRVIRMAKDADDHKLYDEWLSQRAAARAP